MAALAPTISKALASVPDEVQAALREKVRATDMDSNNIDAK
jgi:hypothetical protein